MQLQLSLKIADRLHQELLVRDEPIGVAEAARILLGAATSGPLPLQVLDTLIRDDRRFCWADPARGLLALQSWQRSDPDLSSVAFVALDLETTGAKPGTGKITEVGAVRIEGLTVAKEFHSLVNPQRTIPPMITNITGITEGMVADAPRIEEIMPALMEFLKGTMVVAHNAPFDVGFLNYELHRLRSRKLGEGAIDTLPLSRALVPGLDNYRLKTVAEALGSPVAACHRALADAQAVAHVFIHLAELLESRGVDTLEGVRQHGRSSAPSALHKLPLTRGLPETPGAFTFLDAEGETLLVGRAADLADEVRSLFMAGTRRHRGLPTAVRLVERIDYERSATPIEAVVAEHRLLLEHRPAHNRHRVNPESYVYIAAGGSGPGLTISTTRRPPRWLRDGEGAPPDDRSLIIGPFRRRTSARAAVTLLRDCYPVRHCPRLVERRPCERGGSGACVSPCTGGAEVMMDHDRLVTDLIGWLAGDPPCDMSIDPLQLASHRAEKLTSEGSPTSAEATMEARERLLTVRRAYQALTEARRLSYACLWPHSTDGRRTVRLNVVLRGMLRSAVSLPADDLDHRVGEILNDLTGVNEHHPQTRPDTSHGGLIAVPQRDLDCLLGMRRWFQEGEHAGGVLVPVRGTDTDSVADARTRIVSESRSLLAR